MKLENQVAPLEMAQRMKALGFPQNTVFAWATEPPSDHPWVKLRAAESYDYCRPICAAPTVAEMGEWLPEGFGTMRGANGARRWIGGGPGAVVHQGGSNEAEVRAWILIALAESGALNPPALGTVRV